MVRLTSLVPYIVLSILAIPLIVMYAAFFVQSFSERLTLGIMPGKVGIGNYRFLWKPIPWGLEETTIWEILVNTLLFSLTSALIVTIVSLLSGYAVSRMAFKLRGFFLSLQLLLHAFPGTILLIAIFFLLLYVNLIYKIPGVALARASIEIPLAIWIMKGFFDSIPKEIEESAMLDGCGKMQAWLRIFLPLITPGIAAVFIWGFLFAWHDFIYVYTLLPGRVRLMSTMIQGLIATEVIDFGLLAAMSTFYLAPPLLLFSLLQRVFLKGGIVVGKG